MIISAKKVVFGDRRKAPENVALYIEGNIIKKIASLEELKKQYTDTEVVTYEDATILPGFVDMHMHIGFDGPLNSMEERDPFYLGIFAYMRLKEGLQKGVTTVRDLGSPAGLVKTLKRMVQQDLVSIPKIYSSNQAICMTGGHGAGEVAVVERDGVDEIRKEVRTQIKNGADWIKITTSEGWRGEEYTQEELNAAVAEAHRLKRKAAAHAGSVPSIEMCVQAGFDSIEHGTFITEEDAIKMKENDQTWIPTIYAFWALVEVLTQGGDYMNGAAQNYAIPAINQYEKNFKKIYETGVRVACGTDMVFPGYPALPVVKEVEMMVKYGLTPIQAIEAATKNGADVLGYGDKFGQIMEGYLADLVIVKGDPLKDISVLEDVLAVYKEGLIVK